jgi:hypothetical protein
MRKFLLHCVYIFLIVFAFNLALFFTGKKLYEYTQYSTNFHAYLLADSHGWYLSSLTEEYGAYNFSYPSDSYVDMRRKIRFLIDKGNISTIYLTADEHCLSPYREHRNNHNKSLFYASPGDFGNFYEYLRNKFIHQYAVITHAEIRDVVRRFISSKIKALLIPIPINDAKSWIELSDNKKMESAKGRIGEQFPSNSAPVSIAQRQALLDIINICKEYNIEIIGVKFPLTLEYLNLPGDKDYGVEAIFNENNIRILDYQTVFMHNPEYFRDQDHVNERGARELVKLIGNTMKKVY